MNQSFTEEEIKIILVFLTIYISNYLFMFHRNFVLGNGISRKLNRCRLPATPPGYVFGIVWLILYVLLGLSFVYNYRTRDSRDNKLYLFYGLLCLSLFIWPIVTLYSRRMSLYLLVLCILFTIMCGIISNESAKLCLAPLFTWLLFAVMLSFAGVNNPMCIY